MKRLTAVVLILVLLLVCSGCSRSAQSTFFCMDTVMDVQLWGKDAQEAAGYMQFVLGELEGTWSATDENSLIGSLNRGVDVTLDMSQQALLLKIEELSRRTGGAFDPKLGGLVEAWGFYDENYRIPTSEEIENAVASGKWGLGAAIKGYAGAKCVEALERWNIQRGILNLGGNIQTYGEKPDGTPWQIGIQNPDGGDYVGIVSVEGTASVVTSGDYQRYFELDGVRYHHILDPETGYPADSGLRSVTVICNDGLTADALSTALFVMGLEEGSAFWRQSDDFEAVFILTTGEIYATQGTNLSGCDYEVISREN